MNETWVTVVGNVANEVVLRRVNDASVVSFRIISSERRFDTATGGWQDGERFSARVSCWRRLGENVQVSLVKGDPVIVWGRLTVREYEVDGVRRYQTEIRASSVGPDLARSKAQVSRNRPGDGPAVPRDEVADVTGLTVVGEPVHSAAGDPEDDPDPWGRELRELGPGPDGDAVREVGADASAVADPASADDELPDRSVLAG